MKQSPAIIIDECSGIPKEIFHYLNRLLRKLMGKNKPFGGKLIILGGDFKQTLPVIEKAGREEIIENTIIRS